MTYPRGGTGIADVLADGPLPTGELAQRTETAPEALARLLRLPAARGVFTEMPGHDGRPAWQTVHGAPFWEYLAANPGMSAGFDASVAASEERSESGGGHARVLIVEGPGTADAAAPANGHGPGSEGRADVAEMDLRMLVLVGGRQRYASEYAAMAASAGLSVAATHTTALGQSIIDCRPDTHV